MCDFSRGQFIKMNSSGDRKLKQFNCHGSREIYQRTTHKTDKVQINLYVTS